MTHAHFDAADAGSSTGDIHFDRVDSATLDRAPILAAVTFDEEGRQCLRESCRRACKTGQPVIALHIVHETGRNAGLYRQQDRGVTARPLVDVGRRLLADFSAEVIADEPDCGSRLSQLVVAGMPERRIPEVARLTEAGLIVLGYRPRGGLDRLLGRGVCRAVLRHAPCPVVVLGTDGSCLDPQQLFPDLQRHRYAPVMHTR